MAAHPLLRNATRRCLHTGLLAALIGLLIAPACSLLIESRDEQCTSDVDCARFPGARCDGARHVCAPASGAADAGCLGDGGCYRCTPTTQAELLNACTGASCVPFDNTRLRHLGDAGLPPLPDAADDR